MMKTKEIRKLDLQFRAEDNEEGKMEIKGYAAVFNSPETYSLAPWFCTIGII